MDVCIRERLYVPTLGKFLSEDPIEFKSQDTNHYRYVENNPIKYVDPFGLEKKKCDDDSGLNFSCEDIFPSWMCGSKKDKPKKDPCAAAKSNKAKKCKNAPYGDIKCEIATNQLKNCENRNK